VIMIITVLHPIFVSELILSAVFCSCFPFLFPFIFYAFSVFERQKKQGCVVEELAFF
jgi:hypothetical protein